MWKISNIFIDLDDYNDIPRTQLFASQPAVRNVSGSDSDEEEIDSAEERAIAELESVSR